MAVLDLEPGFAGQRDEFPAVVTALQRLDAVSEKLAEKQDRLRELTEERPRLLREAEKTAISSGNLVDLAGETRECEAHVRLLESSELKCLEELKIARSAAERQIAINLIPRHLDAVRRLVARLNDVAEAVSSARDVEAECITRGCDGLHSPLVTAMNERAQDMIDVWLGELSSYVQENNHA